VWGGNHFASGLGPEGLKLLVKWKGGKLAWKPHENVAKTEYSLGFWGECCVTAEALIPISKHRAAGTTAYNLIPNISP
jgi:hypothetical protein